jgi:hypothetical protein
MLSEPFFDSALDMGIVAEYNKDKTVYESNARLWTQRYATGMVPTDEELDMAGESNERLAAFLESNRND